MATPMTSSQIVAQLKKWGIKYKEVKSWETHNRAGHGAWGGMNGFIWHHTGADVKDAAGYAGSTLYNGLSTLPGPLCHFGLAPDGTVYLVGWGRANHAGGGDPVVLNHVINEDYSGQLHPTKGNANGVDGNAHFYGVEIMYSGSHKMTDAQYKTALKLSAAILDFHKWTEKSVIGHGEWSNDKWDPGYASGKIMDMTKVRSDVRATLKAGANPAPAPAPKPAPAPTPKPWTADIAPKSRETEATIKSQAAEAVKTWPFIPEVEKANGLPDGLLIAVGSRETNLKNVIGDGGHGHGVWQRDDRWHTIPDGYDQDVRKQAEDAAALLAANYKVLKNWGFAVAAYNGGVSGIQAAILAGRSPDSATTGGDYAADVLGRLAFVPVIKPAPVKEVDVADKKDATYKSVWDLDAATPPKGHETDSNPTWAPMSILRGIYEKVEELSKKVDALEAQLKK